jgi:hypothetical protein
VARLSDGAIVGAALMVALLGVDYVAAVAWQIPFVPRAIGQWLHSSLPLGSGVWAVLCVLVGGGIGAIYERARPESPARGMVGGLLIGLLTFVVSLPPTLFAIQNAAVPAVGVVGWLALCFLWGLAVDQTERGATAHPVNPMDTDSPTMSRQVFLLQTVAGVLLIVLLSFPMARLIDGQQLLPNLPYPFSAPPTTPIPPELYF